MQELKEFADSPSALVKDEFVQALDSAIKELYGEVGREEGQLWQSVSVPNEITLGDLSSSVAFKLAKAAKTSPVGIAKEIAKKLKPSEHIVRFEDANGYVNAFIDEKKYAELVLHGIMKRKKGYGRSGIGKRRKVIVESPSANPAHPWHVGTLRNAILGNVVSNLLEACSYEIEREDYIDDLGLQVATALWGFTHTGAKPDKKFDQWLGEIYVDANKQMERPEVKKEVYDLLKKLEEVNSKEAEAGRAMAERCVMAHQETAFNYGIYRDVMVWESDIVRSHLLSKALDISSEILEKPSEGKYAGAIVVKLDKITPYAKQLEGSREDAKVVVRSNGAATYMGKDFALHAWKFGLIDAGFTYSKFMDQPNGKPIYTTSPKGMAMKFGSVKRAINVIDASQAYEQQIMSVMFTLIGHKEITSNLVHLAYGRVNIEGEKLSARSGNWLGDGRNYTADDLLGEATKRAMEIAQKSEKITNKQNLESISRAIALSAIKFEYLRIAPEKEIIFSWQNALNFEGNSGPYVMYTYARARKILAKAGFGDALPSVSDIGRISRGYDFELVKRLAGAQEAVEKACDEARPNVLTDYLLELSSTFSKFYESMPVIKGEGAKNVRLSIVYALTVVLENTLSLLGISTVSEM
ncbi:MAG: arginine--tRNA ligase [Candidatus Micrarchaeota archaeon]|nr:arginine--tRNA ligase [Candidatus Micrarchaeota archaeon]